MIFVTYETVFCVFNKLQKIIELIISKINNNHAYICICCTKRERESFQRVFDPIFKSNLTIFLNKLNKQLCVHILQIKKDVGVIYYMETQLYLFFIRQ